jgi:hypothetical protein
MSPVSRGRKAAKKSRPDQRILRVVPDIPDECDCPGCSGAGFDPGSFVEDVATDGAELLRVEDPLDAEMFGASFVAIGDLAEEGFAETLAERIIPALAERGTPEVLAALLAIDAVDGDRMAADATVRLLNSGLPAPAWRDELSEPVTIGICRRYDDTVSEASMLLCSFERAGRSHGFVIQVDHGDCDAAVDILLFPGNTLDQIIGGVELTVEELDHAEFRWQVERALDARAVHDLEDEEFDPVGDEDEIGYHAMAALLRARMRTLPEPSRPPAPHGHDDQPEDVETSAVLAELLLQAENLQRGSRSLRASAPKLPAKRKKSDGPAPIYQIKVSLRGAKPPIWRRIELPADTSLAELHRIIQVAFGWHDSHLHVFETQYGSFGIADRELDHRAEKPVNLEQVVPTIGTRLQYLYDFGDSWEHEITVEKVVEREQVAYPRCTGGRRAAPPEDCGGIGGYSELVGILGDPGHPEHDERLEWLGLDSADDFQGARFDPAEVTRLLTEK